MSSTVPLIGTGLGYKSLTVNAQSRLNVYLEQQKDQDKGPVAIYGRPGLVEALDVGFNIWAILVNSSNQLMILHDTGNPVLDASLVVYNPYDLNTPAHTPLSTFRTKQAFVDFATDGKIVLFANYKGVEIHGETRAPAYRPDVSVYLAYNGLYSGSVTDLECVGYSDEYFLMAPENSNEFFYTTATAINAATPGTYLSASTDFLAAYSFTDPILRIKGKNGYLMLFGRSGFEAWQVTASGDAPFQPVRGLTQSWGLAAKWSLAETQSGFMFIGKDTTGGYHVCRLNGATITPVMDHEFDAFLLDMAKAGTLTDAVGTTMMHHGHMFYFLNFPSAGKSWMFDANTETFSQTQTGDDPFIGLLATGWGGQSYVAGGGKLYRADAQTYADGDTHMPREFVTRHFWKDHDRLIVDALRVDFETGVGVVDGQGDDPQIMLSISKDNGKTWGNEYWTTLGAIGNYYTRAEWRRLGSGRDFLFKIRITDPVKFAVSGMSIKAQPLGS